MKTNFKIPSTTILDVLSRIRDSLDSSSDQQSSMLSIMLGSLDQEMSDPVFFTSSLGKIFKLNPNNANAGTYILEVFNGNSVLESTDIVDFANEDLDFTLGNGMTIGEVLSNIAGAKNLNQLLVDITNVIISRGNVPVSDIIAIIDNNANGLSTEDVYSLKHLLTTLNVDALSGFSWCSILQTIYQGGKDSVVEDNIELDDSVTTVKGFVGTVFIDAAISVVEIAGLLLAKFTYGLSLLLNVLGSTIRSILNANLKTTAKLDLNVSNNYINVPFLAVTGNNVPGGYDYSYDLTVGDPAQVYGFPGFDVYCWLRNDPNSTQTQYYFNGFINCNVKPEAWERIIQYATHDTNVNATITSYTMTSTLNPYKLFNNEILTDKASYISYSDIITHADDDAYWCSVANYSITAALVAGMFRVSGSQLTGNRNYFLPDYDVTIITRGVPSTTTPSYETLSNRMSNFITSFVITSFYHGSGGSDDTLTFNWSDVANMCRALVEKLSDGGSSVDFPLYLDEDNQPVSESTVDGFVSAWFSNRTLFRMFTSETTIRNEFPSEFIPAKRLLTLPDYTPTALLNTLLIVGGVVALSAVVAITVRAKWRKFTARVNVNRTNTLGDLRSEYYANPTKENFNKLYSKTRWYNFTNRIFGLGSYDMANGLMNTSTNDLLTAGSLQNYYNSVSGIEDIKNLIK